MAATKMTPAAFWSHGSPFMCSKYSTSAECWAQFGREAQSHGIKAIVFIGAHWEEAHDRIRVATKEKPDIVQMDMVPRDIWENYPINVDMALAKRVISLLRSSGFHDVAEDPTFDWHDDAITPARWMFPDGTPPATIVSLNGRYNPASHVKIGRALAPLRKDGVLLCGTGGAVHNLYRNNWIPMITQGDNFQEGRRPAAWAVEFEQAVHDVIAYNKGPKLAGALIRLTKSPGYTAAHPTNEHYFPILVIAGAVVHDDTCGERRAQTWELQNMCNDQFVWGNW